MRATTWIIIVLSVLLAFSVAFSIVSFTISQNIVLKKEIEIKDFKSQNTNLVISKRLRDEIIEKIEIENNFKNTAKIKLLIQQWKQLKETEKEK